MFVKKGQTQSVTANSTDLGRSVTHNVMLLMRGSIGCPRYHSSRFHAKYANRRRTTLKDQVDQGGCDAEVEEETDDVGDGCDHHRRGDRGVLSDTPQE